MLPIDVFVLIFSCIDTFESLQELTSYKLICKDAQKAIAQGIKIKNIRMGYDSKLTNLNNIAFQQIDNLILYSHKNKDNGKKKICLSDLIIRLTYTGINGLKRIKNITIHKSIIVSHSYIYSYNPPCIFVENLMIVLVKDFRYCPNYNLTKKILIKDMFNVSDCVDKITVSRYFEVPYIKFEDIFLYHRYSLNLKCKKFKDVQKLKLGNKKVMCSDEYGLGTLICQTIAMFPNLEKMVIYHKKFHLFMRHMTIPKNTLKEIWIYTEKIEMDKHSTIKKLASEINKNVAIYLNGIKVE
jgi:hypothetical protein